MEAQKEGAAPIQTAANAGTPLKPRKGPAAKPAPSTDLKGLEWVIRERAAEVHKLLTALNARNAVNVLQLDGAQTLAFAQDGAVLQAHLAGAQRLLADAQQTWVDAYVAQQSKP